MELPEKMSPVQSSDCAGLKSMPKWFLKEDCSLELTQTSNATFDDVSGTITGAESCNSTLPIERNKNICGNVVPYIPSYLSAAHHSTRTQSRRHKPLTMITF